MTQTAEHHYQISQKTGFGLLGLAAITVLCLILLDSGIAGAGLFIVGGALGAMFFGVSFGFASGWRNLLPLAMVCRWQASLCLSVCALFYLFRRPLWALMLHAPLRLFQSHCLSELLCSG